MTDRQPINEPDLMAEKRASGWDDTQVIWRTALRQAVATCRVSGQHYIADELDKLQAEIDAIEVSRDSVAVVRGLRERGEAGDVSGEGRRRR